MEKFHRRYRLRVGGLVLAGITAALVGAGCSGGGLTSGGSPSTITATASTLAGSSTPGAANGDSSVATFNNPVNVALDNAGNVYVCDFDNNLIRRITPGGIVSTLTNQANFSRPFGITFTPDGQLYVQTDGNDMGQRDATTGTIWRIDTASGVATVVARDLGRPRGLAALADGRLVLCDLVQNDVRLMNPNTAVITPLAGLRGTAGFVNGTGVAAQFSRPYGAIVTGDQRIILADQNNHCLREVTLAGVVTTFAGDGTPGYRDGAAAQARFSAPQDVAIDNRGNIYVSDNGNHRIRRIASNGLVSTIAGDGTAGYVEGNGLQARFFGQEGIAVNVAGTLLYVADGTGGEDVPFNRVRKLTLQ